MLNGKLDMIGGNDDIFQNGINSFMELHPYFYIHMKHDKLLQLHKLFDPIV